MEINYEKMFILIPRRDVCRFSCGSANLNQASNVKGWSLEIDRSIFEEPKDQRVFLDLKVYKKSYFI